VRSFGILGVINKATEGPGMTDKTFAARRKPARDHDILYGAYHFLRPGNPIAQADHFLEVALSVAQPDELLLALDHEDRSVPLEDAKKWLQRVLEKAGRRAVLYSGFLIKAQLGKRRDPFLAEHRLWLSHFSSRPVCPPNWPAPWIVHASGPRSSASWQSAKLPIGKSRHRRRHEGNPVWRTGYGSGRRNRTRTTTACLP